MLAALDIGPSYQKFPKIQFAKRLISEIYMDQENIQTM